MQQNKQQKMSDKDRAAQYLKDDQEAFDHVQKSRKEGSEKMQRLQALADAYQAALQSGGKQAAKKVLSEALHEAKESPEKEKAEEE